MGLFRKNKEKEFKKMEISENQMNQGITQQIDTDEPLEPSIQEQQFQQPIQKPEKTMVVKELPMVPLRKQKGEDGVIYNFVTLEEAVQRLNEQVEYLTKIAQQ